MTRIIVVDNGSTDDGPAIAERLADDVLEVPQGRISHLRNRGAVQLGEVDVIAFVDADVVVGPQWLAAGLRALTAGADVVGSRSLADPNARWVAARWAEVERHRAHQDSLPWTQHLLVKRTVFEALGGFDERMPTGEDADFSARARAQGYRVQIANDMTATHHGFAPTVRSFLRREIWHTSTPGWHTRMAPASRMLVNLSAAWVVVGAAAAVSSAATRRSAPLAGWLVGCLAGVPVLGRVAGGTLRHSVSDGALLGLWSAVRVARLFGGSARTGSPR